MSRSMEQSPSERVAANLRALLARRRMSGREFSDLMSWSSTSGARRLSGAQPITVDELPEIASRLQVPLADLFDGVEVESAEAATA